MGLLARAKNFKDLVLKKGSIGNKRGLLFRASEFLKRHAANSNKSYGLRVRAAGFIEEGLDSIKKKKKNLIHYRVQKLPPHRDIWTVSEMNFKGKALISLIFLK